MLNLSPIPSCTLTKSLCEGRQDGIGDKFSIFLQLTATFFAGFIVGFAIEAYLTLFMLACTPLLAGASFIFAKAGCHPL